jgi:tetratricopeptide (TPR) repeat protein
MNDFYRNQFAQEYHLDKDNPQGYLEIAKAENKMGNFQSAINNCTRAIEIDPLFVDALYLRGHFYCELEEYQLAISDIDTAINVKPDDYRLYGVRVRACYNSGRYQEALEDIATEINLKPTEDSYFVRGLIRLALKLFREALEDFNRTIDRDPENFMAYYVRSDVYYETQQYEKALSDLDTGKRLEPEGGAEIAYTKMAYKERIDKIMNAIAVSQGREEE